MGKISRIQLRGISRTPSDRMTSDGGCAESLNAYLQDSEIAPALMPEDVTSLVGSDNDFVAEHVFIHKTAAYTNYVLHLLDNNQIGTFVNGQFKGFIALEAGETLEDITAVGNTLVIATSDRMLFALCKDGVYRNLGSRIPEPHIEFRCTPDTGTYRAAPIDLATNASEATTNAINLLNEAAWEKAIRLIDAGYTTDANNHVTRLLEIQNEIWAEANRIIKNRRFNRVFVCPFFVRYAVRLYDGSYIYQSVPILLGAGHDRFMTVRADRYTTSDGITCTVTPVLSKAFSAVAQLRRWDAEGWGDIVKSVDIFVSTDVRYPFFNSNIASLTRTSDGSSDVVDHDIFSIEFDNGGMSDLKAMESELISKSSFYRIASFAAGDNSDLAYGLDLFDTDITLSEDDLAVKDRLPDYEQSGTQIIPSALSTYNGRVLAVGSRRLLPTGYGFMQSTNIVKQGLASATYRMAFFLTGGDGIEHKIVARSYNGAYDMTPYGADTSDEGGSSYSYARPYGLIMFPDSRCTRVRVWQGTDVYEMAMKPHPMLNCSYAYWGLSKTVDEMSQATGDVSASSFVSGENRLEYDSNRLYLSQSGNPFYFPLSGNIIMQADIIDIAIANTALSQGQFGQFPLYVFTREGIWALETASDGSFVASKPLSREVCISRKAITSIDQAVVFISAKGVMLLQGSQITSLSPDMNGRHYAIEEIPKTIIEGTTYAGLLPVLQDRDSFMTFMNDARCAYDYTGRRLVFISPSNRGYQYVYMLDSQTWHKTSYGISLTDTVNSYPDCLAVGVSPSGYTRLHNLSTALDVAEDQETAKIAIATRPFDLDEPDVYKTITGIRIRGQFAPGAVKFILLGSHDGISFHTISTLRGKSWKMFRIILLANLSSTERISWIDVEYETRLTNRLR